MGSHCGRKTERTGRIMKLCSFYKQDGKIAAGIVTEKGIVPLEELGVSKTVSQVISEGEAALSAIRAALESNEAEGLDPEAVRFANVTEAKKLLCIGLNYNSHAVETKGEAPKTPVYFSKFNDCLCPTMHDVFLP